MSTNAVGIDLGTTNSAIAKVNKHGVPESLHNVEGDRITPSVILLTRTTSSSATTQSNRPSPTRNRSWSS